MRAFVVELRGLVGGGLSLAVFLFLDSLELPLPVSALAGIFCAVGASCVVHMLTEQGERA